MHLRVDATTCDSEQLNLIAPHTLFLQLTSERGTRFRASHRDAQFDDGIGCREFQTVSCLQISVDTKSELNFPGLGVSVNQ